jgi:hypothetical protein
MLLRRSLLVVENRPNLLINASQTEGKDLPALTEVNGDVSGYRERLLKFVESQNVELSFSKRIAPAKGLSHGGKITLLSAMQPAEGFSTLVHDHPFMWRRDLCGVRLGMRVKTGCSALTSAK